jgi:rhodanese-related sulfurtransferase
VRNSGNLPLGNLTQRLAELASFKEREVILVCRTQMRSAKAESILKNAGFAHAAVLRGGMVEWVRRRLPIEGSTPTPAVQE